MSIVSSLLSILTLDRCQAYMMHDLDADGDGLITFEELRTGMSKWSRQIQTESKKLGRDTSEFIESTPLVNTGTDMEAAGILTRDERRC